MPDLEHTVGAQRDAESATRPASEQNAPAGAASSSVSSAAPQADRDEADAPAGQRTPSGVKNDGNGAPNERRVIGARDDEYRERIRAEVTHVYITDNRRWDGVYAAGDINTRDFAARDHKVTKDGKDGKGQVRSVSVIAVARHESVKLRKVAIEIGQFERAREILERERFVVLYGPPGVGKGTAAFLLLGLDQDVLCVDPSVTVKHLAEFKQRFPYGPQRRYMVEAMSPATAAQLNSFVARTVTRDLGDQEGYLVLTVDDRVTLSPELAVYVVPWRERPEPAVALRTHLAFYLKDGDVAAVEARYDLAAVHSGLVGRNIGNVDEVARTVVKAFHEARPQAALLDDLGFGAPTRVSEWFATKHSPEQLGFLVAVTVLGGCTYSTVARHARRLEECIIQGSRISKRPLETLRPRSQRLHDAMAVVEPGFVETEFGRSPAEVVKLESHWHVRGVLDIVWREYDLVANALVEWLREAGNDHDPGVRQRAAIAAGYLSQHDFAAIREQLLLGWAWGTSEESLAAADALGEAAWSELTAPLALALLDVWACADNETSFDLWWTAAAAYGGEAGVRFPGVAMDRLLGILLRGDPRAPSIVADSAVRLVQSGGRFNAAIVARVFSHLTAWLKDDPTAAFTARMAYAELMRRASDPDWPSSTEYRRVLVEQTHGESSARLLRATLAEKTFRHYALEALKLMVRAFDDDDGAREPLEALLLNVAHGPGSTPTDGQRLTHYLDRWAVGQEPSPAARAIASRLQEVTVR